MPILIKACPPGSIKWMLNKERKWERMIAMILILVALFITGCKDKAITQLNRGKTLGIVRHPQPIDYSNFPGHGKLASLPHYLPSSTKNWQVDIRSADLTALDLRGRLNDLIHADFDSKTKWPDKLPDDFKPEMIMEIGENPGLNVRKLHKKGITGRGIGIAIIDQTLLVDHIEYKERIKLYEEIHCLEPTYSSMHGSAVASIAVGKTVGVAPEADLYYIAENHWTIKKDKYRGSLSETDFTYLAKSIDRILEINKTLQENRKIRVLSISVGWGPKQKGYKEIIESVDRAKSHGIFIVSSSIYKTYDNKFYFHGLGRDPLKNPDDFNSYGPGSWWAKKFYSGREYSPIEEGLLVPMDSRSTASPTGVEDYVFYSIGGWSWSIPYIAALYALCCQIRPDITPHIFWTGALKTGESIEIEKNGKKYQLGKIVNPVKLIQAIRT